MKTINILGWACLVLFLGLIVLLVIYELIPPIPPISDTEQVIDFLPPGYEILCDDKGNFLPTMPGGTRLYKSYPYIPFKDRQKAIKKAWEQYNHKSPPPDTTEWYDCTGTIEVVKDSILGTQDSITWVWIQNSIQDLDSTKQIEFDAICAERGHITSNYEITTCIAWQPHYIDLSDRILIIYNDPNIMSYTCQRCGRAMSHKSKPDTITIWRKEQ